MRKILVFGCLLPLLALAGAGAYLYHLATWKPSPALLPPPPPPATARRARAKIEAVAAQVKQVKQSRRARTRLAQRRFHLALKEDEINGLLTRDRDVRQAVTESGLRDARVSLDGDHVTVSGFTKAAGPEVYVSATGNVSRDTAGKLAVELESVRVGQLPAPPALRRMIEEKVRQAVRNTNRDLAARLDDLRVGDGGLTVDGELKP